MDYNVVKERLQKTWTYVRKHKYMITIGVFLLIIGVIDENSMIQRISHRAEIHRLN